MSVNQTVNSSGLIFCFDTNNIKSFLGKPATNIITGITSWNGTVDTANYKILDSVEKVYIPGLKKYYDCRYVQIYNNDSANYCCPSLLQYGWPATAVTGNTLYTYSIIYKCTSHYSNSNYMYHYEYGPSGYITEYGVFDTSKRTDLGGGWYHAWNTFTTNVNCNNIYCGSWYYQYGVYDRFYVAAANIVAGNYLLSPLQMLEPNQTRSNTQGLLDLTGNYILDLTNAGFDSAGNLTFNRATPNSIDLNTQSLITGTNPFTIEAWYNVNTNTGCEIIGNYGTSYTSGNLWFAEAGLWINGSVYFDSYQSTMQGLHHIVATRDGSGNVKLYKEGNLAKTGTLTSSVPSNINWRIGADVNGGAEGFNGSIYTVKVYNRVLTASEVLQNFNATKGRFGL